MFLKEFSVPISSNWCSQPDPIIKFTDDALKAGKRLFIGIFLTYSLINILALFIDPTFMITLGIYSESAFRESDFSLLGKILLIPFIPVLSLFFIVLYLAAILFIETIVLFIPAIIISSLDTFLGIRWLTGKWFFYIFSRYITVIFFIVPIKYIFQSLNYKSK